MQLHPGRLEGGNRQTTGRACRKGFPQKRNPLWAHTVSHTLEHRSMEATSIHEAHTEPKPLSSSDTAKDMQEIRVRKEGAAPQDIQPVM